MEWQLPAGGWSPQPHVHPHITETYEVLDGELELLINRSWRRLRPGDRASVEAGAVHTFRVGPVPARVRNVHRPACDFEPYIRALCATANARDLGDLGGPRALLYIAMLVDEFPEHSRAAGRALTLPPLPWPPWRGCCASGLPRIAAARSVRRARELMAGPTDACHTPSGIAMAS